MSGPRGPPPARPGLPAHPACPHCGGHRTRLESAFGSVIGTAQYSCPDCRSVFEHVKWAR